MCPHGSHPRPPASHNLRFMPSSNSCHLRETFRRHPGIRLGFRPCPGCLCLTDSDIGGRKSSVLPSQASSAVTAGWTPSQTPSHPCRHGPPVLLPRTPENTEASARTWIQNQKNKKIKRKKERSGDKAQPWKPRGKINKKVVFREFLVQKRNK